MNRNRARIWVVAVLAAATAATGARGQTEDGVAACDSPSTTVRLSNREDIVLNQNSPNPFIEQTTITYKVPDAVKTAKIVFSDARGERIKTVDVSSSRGRSGFAECAGEGRLFVFSDDLSDGRYTYALVLDEKTVATKEMLKARSR